VIVGVALSLLLTVLSVVRVSPSGVSYRSPQTWSNQATLVLTQAGAPEFRSVLPSTPTGSSSLADTSRFNGLIDVYAAMATSDPVIQVLKRRGLIKAADLENGANPLTAVPVVSTVGGGTTPMLMLTATAPSATKATKLTLSATQAFLKYVAQSQAAADMPAKGRIEIRVVKGADAPKIAKPRSKALPVLVLLAGLIATAAVVFVRDNVQRRQASPSLSEASRREPVEREPSVAHVRAPVGPVPGPDAPAAREEPDGSVSVAQRRPTLGSVPREDSGEDGSSVEVAQQAPALRRAGKSRRPQG
jgi:hypothetical protein